MKVLHVINTLSAGGAELHLLTLCRDLKARGIEVEVACLREVVSGSRLLRADFEKENIHVYNVDADSRYNLSFISRLAFLVKRLGPDIFHTHLPRADIAGAFISRLVKPPVFLCSVHGIYRKRWFGTLAAPAMRLAYRKAGAIIAISAGVKAWLQSDLGIDEEKIKVVHYGIDAQEFSCSNSAVSIEEHRGRLIVGSIGRLEPGKGFDCLIRALKIVRKQIPNASLRIAGHDPLGYGKDLKALITELGLNETVELVGFQRDVASFLSATDVFAFASLSEGFGQVIIEAMAAGKPVVASKISPLSEIVQDNKTGLLVNPSDSLGFAEAILWLLRHPEQAREMGKRGRERVYSHFSAQRMADETLSLYNSLLEYSYDELAVIP